MNNLEYNEKRQAMLEEAENLINKNKINEANSKLEDLEKFDNDYQEASKLMANLNALKDKNQMTNISNMSLNVKNWKTMESIDNTIEDIEEMTNTIGYRKAFMNYVCNGIDIPSEFKNADASTHTTDIGEIIPVTVLEKIIDKMESTGMIYAAVTKTNYPGGLKVPVSSIKPVASWVAEGSGSEKQKKTVTFIDFTYNKLRCAVSMSLEVDTMALPIFEATFIANVAEAMVKALEQAIISGTGTGQPKGILAETVVTGQNVDVAKTANVTYKTLTTAEGALPLAYENNAVWCMTKKTFMEFASMTDSQGQPIGHVNYGIDGKIERMLLGRTVILNDYMTNISSALTKDTVVAFLFNFNDYILNSNLNLTVRRYEDYNTDDIVNKALMLTDGKVVDKNSLVTITKKYS